MQNIIYDKLKQQCFPNLSELYYIYITTIYTKVDYYDLTYLYSK